MSDNTLEKRIEILEDQLQQQAEYIETLEKKVTKLDDIEAIKRLQKAYGYYVEHWMYEEIIDCFSDGPGVYLNWIEGVWKGKKGVRRYFTHGGKATPTPSGFSHQLMPTSGLITVTDDGMTAKGRWYGFGAIFNSNEGQVEKAEFTSGIYEVNYVKEDSIWKIRSFDWVIPYVVRIHEMCEGPEIRSRRIIKGAGEGGAFIPDPDIPLDENDLRYVSGYVFPFHYTHPVTGKRTSEERRNAQLRPLQME
ncbi:MAG: nuclear transport factor 2 family protein [Dehalococcoidales bacterium]|nr:MAG: nuclear transport factor 2 family protein [Dehalococcoidales bacterium]